MALIVTVALFASILIAFIAPIDLPLYDLLEWIVSRKLDQFMTAWGALSVST